MRSLPLRWRIVIALIALTLGTTLALSLLAQHFLESGLQLQDNISASTSRALNDAVELARNHYESRKEGAGRYRKPSLPVADADGSLSYGEPSASPRSPGQAAACPTHSSGLHRPRKSRR